MPLLRKARASLSKFRPLPKRRSTRLRRRHGRPSADDPVAAVRVIPPTVLSENAGEHAICCTRQGVNDELQRAPMDAHDGVSKEDVHVMMCTAEDGASTSDGRSFESNPLATLIPAEANNVVRSEGTVETAVALDLHESNKERPGEYADFLRYLATPEPVPAAPTEVVDGCKNVEQPSAASREEREQGLSSLDEKADPRTVAEEERRRSAKAKESSADTAIQTGRPDLHNNGVTIGDRVRVVKRGHKHHGLSGIVERRTACYVYFREDTTRDIIKIMPQSLALVTGETATAEEGMQTRSIAPTVTSQKPSDFPIGGRVAVVPTHRKHGGREGTVQRHTKCFVVVRFDDACEDTRISPRFLEMCSAAP